MDTYRYALTPVDMQVEYAKLEHDFQTLPESWRKEPQEDLVHALSEMAFVFTSSFESKIHQHYYGTLDNEADETRNLCFMK